MDAGLAKLMNSSVGTSALKALDTILKTDNTTIANNAADRLFNSFKNSAKLVGSDEVMYNYTGTWTSDYGDNVQGGFGENDYVYTRVIRSTDIDINNHTNNLKYNFMAMDALSVEDLKSSKIKEYEIYFVNESYEGDKIDVFKKKLKNYIYVEGKILDKTIFRAVFKA